MKVACFGVADTESEVSVWDSPAELQTWLHRTAADDPADSVAWWVAPRHRPSLGEATARLAFLREHGPSPYAFTPRRLREPLSIDRVHLDDPDVQLLIAQLNAELQQRYPEPGALVFSLHPADIQPEATRRYERAGYAVCEPWGEFIGKELSVCMEKRLADAG